MIQRSISSLTHHFAALRAPMYVVLYVPCDRNPRIGSTEVAISQIKGSPFLALCRSTLVITDERSDDVIFSCRDAPASIIPPTTTPTTIRMWGSSSSTPLAVVVRAPPSSLGMVAAAAAFFSRRTVGPSSHSNTRGHGMDPPSSPVLLLLLPPETNQEVPSNTGQGSSFE